MPIETSNLVFYESERKTDNSDGGGKYSGKVVQDGVSNNLFDDITELDRTAGDVSIRKVFAAVTTNDTDKLMGASVFVSKNPQDPNVSSLLFSTNSYTDQRNAAKDRIENYLGKGALATGTPLDTHYQGMKTLQVAMFSTDAENAIGQTIVLISNEGKANQVMQYVRITEVSTREATMMVNDKLISYKIATYTLNNALSVDYVGLSAQQWYMGQKSTTIIRDTINADTGKYYSSVDLKSDVEVGSYVANATNIFSQIVPSAQSETPLIDINAAGDAIALVPSASGQITKTFSNVAINTIQALYIGSAILPKSVEFTLFGSAITDVGGELKNANNLVIGTIDYQNGQIQWNANAGTGTQNITVKFTPAGKSTSPVESEMILVTSENNSYNWIRNIVPLPTPGSLQVSYMAQDRVYTLKDNGSGQLKGTDSAFGVGTINYSNGTMSLTVGALPDVSSVILITWGNQNSSQERSGLTVEKPYIEIPVNDSIVAGSLTVTWLLNGVTKTATDNGLGAFAGDATGKIDYAEGIAKLAPNLLPNGGTTFNVDGQKGGKLSTVVTGIPSGGTVTVSLDSVTTALAPNSVKVRVPVRSADGSHSGEIELYDRRINDSSGRMVNSTGQQQGSIDYVSKTITITPTTTAQFIDQVEVATRESIYRVSGSMGGSINVYQDVKKLEKKAVNHTLSLANVVSSISVAVSYRDTSSASTYSDTIVANSLKTDLTEGFAEQILSESVRFILGGATYIDRVGSLYRDPSITTGAGTIAGQVHYGDGTVVITNWNVGAANSITLESLATQVSGVKTNQVAFRAPILPIRAQSLTISATKVEGGVLNVTPDEYGVIENNSCGGFFNFEQGYGQFVFRKKIQITQANRPEITSQSWYDPAMEYTDGGTTWIHEPIYVLPESIRFSAVAYSYIPLSEDVIGLSATRLPLDGRVPIFRSGEFMIISSSKSQELPTHIAGTTYNLNDQRIAWCELVDSEGLKVPTALYEVDYDHGKVTLRGDFTLGSLEAPIFAEYRYQDMGLIRDVQINGQLTLTKPITHNYSIHDSIVGSALIIGDMQARYTNKFVQQSQGTWSDSQTTGSISANYNDSIYPIEVTNNGAIQERWAIVFTGTSTFRCVGEYTGELTLTGNVNADYQPINPVTGVPYFVVKKEGWGAGWANGNTLRFNTVAAIYPIWVIRTVKQSEPTTLSDEFQIMLRGDIDRVIN